MTQPTPTQSKHPWRATARTGLAVVLGFIPILVEIIYGLDLDTTAIGAQVLTYTAAVTRVLAIPAVNEWLQRHLPDFAAQPPGLTPPRPHADVSL